MEKSRETTPPVEMAVWGDDGEPQLTVGRLWRALLWGTAAGGLIVAVLALVVP